MTQAKTRRSRSATPILALLAGVAAGGAGAILAAALTHRRRFNPDLVDLPRDHEDLLDTVVVPGILGTQLIKPDGTEAWLNAGNALGFHDLRLPWRLPLAESRDELVPSGLLGIDRLLPRIFGFTEYADLVHLLERGGFQRGMGRDGGPRYHIVSYDWRRDIVEGARALHQALEALDEATGGRQTRFNLVAHSLGGLIARYYLRYGCAEPTAGAPVTWAGAQRIGTLILSATPNSGSIPALDALLRGSRVGLSTTTLSASTSRGMPSLYALLPPKGTHPLVDHAGDPLDEDLHDVETWRRRHWGPFRHPRSRERSRRTPRSDREPQQLFVKACLERARAVHDALSRVPETPCPVRVVLLGGDCLPTLARALVPDRPFALPRFEASTRREVRAMFQAGDGRVTRASTLASHLPGARHSELGSGLPEVSQTFIGQTDHHGMYGEATFQSVLLRLLLRPAATRATIGHRAAGARNPHR